MNGLGWSEIYDFISLSIKIFFFFKEKKHKKKVACQRSRSKNNGLFTNEIVSSEYINWVLTF